jgi:hypothetical protein
MNSISKVTNLETNTTDGRTQLNEYLESPLQLATGTLSTQTTMSATSLSTGGLSGDFIIKDNGRILVHDGTVYRVVIGKLS